MSLNSPEARFAASADLAACAALLRGGSRSFHAASRLLPRRVAEPAMALYAFCRIADDAVDGSAHRSHACRLAGNWNEGRDAAVLRLRERLDSCYAGQPEPSPVDRAFARTVAHFGIPRALPEGLLEGLAWDAEGRRYETLADLTAYAARVAGTVGAMMTVIMGSRDPKTLARACDLGIAMQLTNIARDVGEDARMGRLYLPLTWLRAGGIDPQTFLNDPRPSPALARIVSDLLEAADVLYARSAEGIANLPLSCRMGINAARLIYAEIGREVARAGYDSVTRRAAVPDSRKARLAVQALVTLPTRRHRHTAPLIPETRFLVEAVAALPVPARAAGPNTLLRLLALFERLERGERGFAGS
jgi:phytoene synthase